LAAHLLLRFQIMQVGINAALAKGQGFAGLGPDFVHDLVAVHFASGQQEQHQQLRDAIYKTRIGFLHRGDNTLNHEVCQHQTVIYAPEKAAEGRRSQKRKRFSAIYESREASWNAPVLWRFAGGGQDSAPHAWKFASKKKRLCSLVHHSNILV
jgi:hypothetical protein